MRTAEGSSGTVLHRLIQEQLRYGNLTDTRTLLAIQQQALRGGSSSGGGGAGSSLESLSQDEAPFLQGSKRQEPQGQEHQGDGLHSESQLCQLYQLHGEELPTYEEAKAYSQYLSTQGGASGDAMGGHSEGQWDAKREHARSLSERLLQLTLERNAGRLSLALSSSHSYPQLHSQPAPGLSPQDGQGAPVCAQQRGPPPEYPIRLPGYMVSHSATQEHGLYCRQAPPPMYSQNHRFVSTQHQYNDAAAPGGHMVQSDSLARENERLRKELEVYVEKAARLQKLELEIQRISEAYETLMKGSAKRETLEKTMRNKLEAEIKRMHDFNRDLREQLDTATRQRVAREAECSDQRQHVFVKLLEQNEEQQRERERLEKQIQQLRVCEEENQHRQELLEKALASTQARNRQLEEELQRKRAYVEKVERLQSALAQLQAACEKRETLELRLRTRLEQELKNLRAQQSQNQASDPSASELSSSTLQQQLREREERVLALEADITRWEQKYLEESTMRQFAMDAAATAAAQRDTTIINHSPRHSPNSSFNEELPLSSHRHQEMENRIRVLHAKLLEKDAVIKVLQQRSRWEQCRLEKQGMRLTRSVPSINTAAAAAAASSSSHRTSLSDDPTGAAALQPRPLEGPRRRQSNDAGTEETESAATADASEASLTTQKSINSSDADVVEILI